MKTPFKSLGIAIARGWSWLATHKDSLTIAFAFIAGCTALYQYLQSVDDSRRKETLKYVDRAQETRVGQARAEIAMVLLDAGKRKEYTQAANAASRVPKDVTLLDKFVNDNNLEVNLIVLTEHFMNLAGCVKAGVCDAVLACEYFKTDVNALNNSFRQLFDTTWKERAGVNYMAGPMEFVRSCNAK